MKSPLHILHLEDDPRDMALIQSTLKDEGIACTITCVEKRGDFVGALEHGGIDLVFSDFSLPAFDGLSALEIVRVRWPGLPVIMVSGSLGEERAIDSLKSGATDYVLKDRLGRLAPAVRRAMKEVEEQATNRRTKESLRETEQQLRIVFSESPLGIALVGVDGRPLLTNAALQKMLGYTGEELSRMPFTEFTHPEDCAKDVDLYQQLIQGTRHSYQIEKRYLRKDGQVVFGRLSVNVAREPANHSNFAIGMVEDITDRRNLETQFIEAQKMDVIGQLASGVAHDFNNILAIVMGYNDLLAKELPPDSPFQGYSEEIRLASARAAQLTKQLLVFSRKQTVQPAILDLNVVVQDLDKMLRRLIGEHIEMAVVSGESIGHIKADSGYIGQVVMNLAINARDAMPDGGKLTIATNNVTLDVEHECGRKTVIPGNYVMLSVQDTGTGMNSNVKAHLFEAFFTTKPLGKGTGLGLATCRTIVEQCLGHISFSSEVGKGTIFRVYFPRVYQPLNVETSPVPTGPLPRGTETLLLVEDEPGVRQMACRVLENQGYEVLSAPNGQDALRVARDHRGNPIQLVVSDVIMPRMGGKAMAEWLKTAYPDLKILFTSGYTDGDIVESGVLAAGVVFLPKPYTPATLAYKVREMLDGN